MTKRERTRLIRLGKELRASARVLRAEAARISREAAWHTRRRHPRLAAAARAEAAALRARAEDQLARAREISARLARERARRYREREKALRRIIIDYKRKPLKGKALERKKLAEELGLNEQEQMVAAAKPGKARNRKLVKILQKHRINLTLEQYMLLFGKRERK